MAICKPVMFLPTRTGVKVYRLVALLGVVAVEAGTVFIGCGSGAPAKSSVMTGPGDASSRDSSTRGSGDSSAESSGDSSAGGSSDSSTGASDSPPVTTVTFPAAALWDGAVADTPCSTLPASGAWKNISPPGSNYTQTTTGINTVVVRPDNPAIVYAGADSVGIFRSTDCGATWAIVNTGANAAAMKSGRPWSMKIDPMYPDVMYAVEGYGQSGLWKSTNAGVDWGQILTSNITSAFYSGGQITGISIDPTDHTHLVVESHGNCASTGKACAAESTDWGATWNLINMDAIGAWAENSAVVIVNRKTWLYCGLFSGMFLTTDEGATWTAVSVGNALPSTNVYEPYIWQASDGHYYLPGLSYGGSGLIESAANDASTWTVVANGPIGTTLYPTETQLFLTNQFGNNDYIASQTDPSTWKSFPTPTPDGPSGSGGVYLAYDSVHHVLYQSGFNLGLWQTIIE